MIVGVVNRDLAAYACVQTSVHVHDIDVILIGGEPRGQGHAAGVDVEVRVA